MGDKELTDEEMKHQKSSEGPPNAHFTVNWKKTETDLFQTRKLECSEV